MRLVVDTNVIISAIFWGGVPRQVLELAQSKHILCFSRDTINELERVLNYPKLETYFLRLNFSIFELFEKLTENSLIITNPRINLTVIKDDLSDNKFLTCAVACQASFIITGDRHLLNLKEYERVKIITPKEFTDKFI